MDTSTIRHYMTPSPHTIGIDQALATATELMRAHKIRHLPVLAGGALVGLLSERDLELISGLPSVDPSRLTVEDAMSDIVYTVAPDDTLAEVAAEMAAHKYGSAVVAQAGRVVGVFTTVDALHALSDALSTAGKPKRTAARR
jgi:acetoin utilization protein AcuB